ncbi:MAG: hypothetical protein ABIO29_08870 [Sphingomicrobium sp.]
METATPRPKFSSFHHSDRRFYAIFLAFCWLGVLFGFFPAASARYGGNADYPAPLILIIHASLFVGWLILLSLQIALVRTNQLRMHKWLGQIGYLFIPLMIYSGLAGELYNQRLNAEHPDYGLHFLIFPLYYVIGFGIFGTWALAVARRDPVAHKRLIILATTVIVGVGYARWWGSILYRVFGDEYWGTILRTFSGTNMLLAMAVGFDIWTRGRPHRVYQIGVPAVLVAELICSYVYHSVWWMPVARHLIAIRLPLSG